MASFFDKYINPMSKNHWLNPGGDNFWGKMFGGGGNDFDQLPTMGPEQLEYLKQMFTGGGIESSPLYGAGSNFLQNLYSGGDEAFRNFEAPFKRQFNEETVPGIANRFAGAGTGGGAMSSSGLNQSLARAGEGLSTNLAAMRSGMQMQGLGPLMQFAQQPHANKMQGLGISPFAYTEKKGGIQNLMAQLLPILMQAGMAAI